MADDSAVFLGCSRQEGRDIHQCQDRQAEAVAEPDKTGHFVRCMIIQGTAHNRGLIRHEAYGFPVHTGKSDHHIPGKILLYLKKASFIRNPANDILHVIGTPGIIRHNALQIRAWVITAFLAAVYFPAQAAHMLQYLVNIAGKRLFFFQSDDWRFFLKIGGKIIQELAHSHQAFPFGIISEMGNTAFFRMDLGSAQLFHSGHFIDNRFHHIGAGYEHLGGILHHENEITDGGRIAGAAGAGAQNHRDLGNHAGSLGMAQEHSRVAA